MGAYLGKWLERQRGAMQASTYAKKLGISRSSLSQIEHGTRPLPDSAAKRLLRSGVSNDVLAGVRLTDRLLADCDGVGVAQAWPAMVDTIEEKWRRGDGPALSDEEAHFTRNRAPCPLPPQSGVLDRRSPPDPVDSGVRLSQAIRKGWDPKGKMTSEQFMGVMADLIALRPGRVHILASVLSADGRLDIEQANAALLADAITALARVLGEHSEARVLASPGN